MRNLRRSLPCNCTPASHSDGNHSDHCDRCNHCEHCDQCNRCKHCHYQHRYHQHCIARLQAARLAKLLRQGDLLFVGSGASNLAQLIERSTRSSAQIRIQAQEQEPTQASTQAYATDTNEQAQSLTHAAPRSQKLPSYSHVGILEHVGGSWRVIEATPNAGVVRTPLSLLLAGKAVAASHARAIAARKANNASKASRANYISRASLTNGAHTSAHTSRHAAHAKRSRRTSNQSAAQSLQNMPRFDIYRLAEPPLQPRAARAVISRAKSALGLPYNAAFLPPAFPYVAPVSTSSSTSTHATASTPALSFTAAALPTPPLAAYTHGFYCSQLAQYAFAPFHAFESQPMEFGPGGVILPQWRAYYAKLDLPTPLGEPGTNPNMLIRQGSLRLICSL